MRIKPTTIALTGALAFLIATNPVVVNAAGEISGADIKNNSLTGKDVKDGSLKGADFKAGDLPAGATGPAGPAGATGPTGATGPLGPTGPQGVVRVNNFIGGIAPEAAPLSSGVLTFLGPTTSVVVTSADQVMVGEATFAVASSAAGGQIGVDICYQPTNGTVASFGAGTVFEVGTQRISQSASGAVRRPPGTYQVGLCAATFNGTPILNDNDFVNGWVAVINAPVSGGSLPRQDAAGLRR